MSFTTDPFNDTFSRISASGLGTSDSGHTWTAPSEYSIDGERAIVTIAAVNTGYTALVDGTSEADVDMYASFVVLTPPVGDSLGLQLLARHASGDYTYGRVSILPSGGTNLYIQNSGSSTSATAGPVWTGETVVHMHYRMIGTSARLKIWYGEAEEPVNWNLSKTITSTNASGQVGIRVILGAASTNTLPYEVHLDDAIFATATPGLSIIDSFDSRVVAGGFGVADSEHPWTAPGGGPAQSVGSDVAIFSQDETVATSRATVDLTVTDCRIELKINVPVTLPNTFSVGGVVRWTDTSNYVWFYAQITTANAVSLLINNRIAGVTTTYGPIALGATYTPGEWLSLVGEITGTQVKAKLWKTVSSEPAAWTISQIAAALPAAGVVGLQSSRSTSVAGVGVVQVDDLLVRDILPKIEAIVTDAPDSPGVRLDVSNGDVYHAIRVQRVHVDNSYPPTAIRGLDVVNIPSAITSVVDYEMPLDESFVYHVYALDVDDNVVSSSQSDPVSVVVPYHRVLLRSVGQPTLSRRIQITSFPSFNRELRILQEAKVLRKTTPVILFDVLEGMTGSFKFITLVGNEPVGWELRDLIESGQPLLFQSVNRITGLDDFYCVIKSIEAERKTSVHPTEAPRYIYTAEFQEVSRPPTDSESLGFFSWQSLITAGHADWQSVDNSFTTWLAVLNFANRTPL